MPLASPWASLVDMRGQNWAALGNRHQWGGHSEEQLAGHSTDLTETKEDNDKGPEAAQLRLEILRVLGTSSPS